jgi:hypothetical protein
MSIEKLFLYKDATGVGFVDEAVRGGGDWARVLGDWALDWGLLKERPFVVICSAAFRL